MKTYTATTEDKQGTWEHTLSAENHKQAVKKARVMVSLLNRLEPHKSKLTSVKLER